MWQPDVDASGAEVKSKQEALLASGEVSFDSEQATASLADYLLSQSALL